MPNIEIKHLFRRNRLPEDEFKLLCLVFYAPIGIVLLLLRTLLALCVVLIGCTLADTSIIHKLVNKIACLALGISVTVENPDKKENVDVYITNNLSIFDHVVVHSVTNSVSPGGQMHPALGKGLGVHHFGASPSSAEPFKKNALAFVSEQGMKLHFSPEDKITNGRALLKFKPYAFAISPKVQPVCLKVERPFLDVAVTTLGSSYWSDVFCYMFSPVTSYRVKFLPPLERKSLNEADFGEIVRQNIAAELKVETPDLSAADLNEWEKRQLAEQQQQRAQTAARVPSVDSNVVRMATQVKEVLPHVPLSAIYKDLNKTRNVDSTITNILEGRVQFVAEAVGQASTSGGSGAGATSPSLGVISASDSSSGPPGSFNTAASSFAKSAQERTKSFQERKELLIACARRRYIEKHNLDLPF